VAAEPFPTCYLNGAYLPLAEARVSPLDRGFLFADSVYEVMPAYAGRPFRFEAHCERLTRSLAEIRMPDPHTREQWHQIIAGLIERNGVVDPSTSLQPRHGEVESPLVRPHVDLYVYWQVTRGAERGRNPAPLPNIPRTVFAFCSPLPVPTAATLQDGLKCVTATDTRWARCDIKSVALLANVLLRQLATDADAAETILLRDGEVLEASAAAVHVVIGGELRSPPNSQKILPGTTRNVVELMAERAGVPYRSVPVSESHLRSADEICLSAATREIQPVTWLDGRAVGAGKPGPVWRRLFDELQRYKQELSTQPW
jgi:D-alanine transaminase